MRRYRFVAALLSVCYCTAVWGQGSLRLFSAPTSETLNGIATSADGLRIAVGDSGTIIHFDGSIPDGRVVASGTTTDLFDVYARSHDLAVVSGANTMLLWDGAGYSPLVTLNQTPAAPINPMWITPERDRALYAIVGGPFGATLCAESLTSAPSPAFCRAGALPLAFCGQSDGFFAVDTRGDIQHLTSSLAIPEGASHQGAIFLAPTNLNLTAAWINEGTCFPRSGISSLEIFAISGQSTLMRFANESWSTVGMADPGQTLNWLSGTSSVNVVAVGSEPGGTPGDNNGVLWVYDGTNFAQESLPAGTPGLSDIAMQVRFFDQVFGGPGGGYEGISQSGQRQSRFGARKTREPESLYEYFMLMVGEDGDLVEQCSSRPDDLVGGSGGATDVFVKQRTTFIGSEMAIVNLTIGNQGIMEAPVVKVHVNGVNGGFQAHTCPDVAFVSSDMLGFGFSFDVGPLAGGSRVECAVQLDPGGFGPAALQIEAPASGFPDVQPSNNFSLQIIGE